MEITLKDILTTYWAQTVLLLATLGFLIKRLFDLRTKRIEMKQSLFQQNRNIAIIRFIDAYVGLQGLYRQILSQTFDLNKIGNSNFYNLIDDKYEQLYSSYFYFKFFLDPLEQVRYADLVKEMQNIFSKIADVATKSSSDDKNLMIADLKQYISEKLKENNDNIKVIGEIFRENSTKHFPVRLK
ncbi:MAG: hypothetical protein EOO46_15175 [Flavobacterium sp.]|nr:MAG: hypothetical protein EOO46_15175 [Flavobacterium sp.]